MDQVSTIIHVNHMSHKSHLTAKAILNIFCLGLCTVTRPYSSFLAVLVSYLTLSPTVALAEYGTPLCCVLRDLAWCWVLQTHPGLTSPSGSVAPEIVLKDRTCMCCLYSPLPFSRGGNVMGYDHRVVFSPGSVSIFPTAPRLLAMHFRPCCPWETAVVWQPQGCVPSAEELRELCSCL